jgi:tripartite-type tricarboxylate transporter receptor subunit TctC
MSTAAPTSISASRRAILVAGLAAPSIARAQDNFPDRPVRFVVPYSAGGGTDVTAREVAQRLSPLLGQPVIVENRSGANTAVGAEYVVRSRPDGYTLYFAGASSVVVPPLVWRRLPYGPADFAPVSLVLKQPYGLGVGPWAAGSVPELIERMRAAPGTFSFGHTGTGGIGHLLGERLMSATGTRMVSVPYRGFAQTVVDIIGRRLQMTFEATNNILSFHRDGTVRVLAITSDRRVPQLPDVPTFTEIGLPEMEVVSWLAVFAPAASSPAVITRLSEAIRSVVESEPFRAYALTQVQFAEGSTPEGLRDYMAADIAAWRRVIEPLNLQVE